MQTVKTYRTLNDYRICPEPMFDDSQASNSSKIAKGVLLVALVFGVGSYVYSVTQQPRAVAQSDGNQGTTQNAQGTAPTAAPVSAQNAQAVVTPMPTTDSDPSAAELRAAAAEQTTPIAAAPDKNAAPLKKAAPEPGVATPSTKTKVARAERNTEEQPNSATTNTAQSPDASDSTAEPAPSMATTPAAEPSAPVVTVPPTTASDPAPVANVGDDSANPAG